MQQTGKYGQETFQTFTKDINENGLNKTLDSTFGGIFGHNNNNNGSNQGNQVPNAFGFKNLIMVLNMKVYLVDQRKTMMMMINGMILITSISLVLLFVF